MDELIFQNIEELITPIGSFTVTEGEKKIPFSVSKNQFDLPYEVYGKDNKSVIATIQTQTNYDIIINVSDLEIGHSYKLAFSEKMVFCDSDEHTEALSITKDNWSVGLGMYDPNDGVINSMWPASKAEIDESVFVRYSIEASPGSTGYIFKLLDKSFPRIYFPVAWVKNEGLPPIEYESALGYWLT